MQFVLINMSFDIEYLAVEFVKLQDRQHQFDYQLDKTFFEHFDNHDIQEADLKVEMDIVRNGNLMIADLYTSGIISDSCDRCLSKIGLPIEAEFKIIYHLNSNHENNENVRIPLEFHKTCRNHADNTGHHDNTKIPRETYEKMKIIEH